MTNRARYRVMPDKESPLWHVHAPVIYWWTSSPAPSNNFYIVSFNGRVWHGSWAVDDLAFRAVKARQQPRSLPTQQETGRGPE